MGTEQIRVSPGTMERIEHHFQPDGTTHMLQHALDNPQNPFQHMIASLSHAGGKASIESLAQETGLPSDQIRTWGTRFEGILSVEGDTLTCERLTRPTPHHPKVVVEFT